MNERRLTALVVFYSRTGTTKAIAMKIRDIMDCDMEEVFDSKSRSGWLGWLRSGREARARSLTTLKGFERDPSLYDVVIVGSPTWNNKVSTPIRTWLHEYRESVKKAAFFCTQDSENSKTLEEMEDVFGRTPIAVLALRKKQDIRTGDYVEMLEKFVNRVLRLC